MRLVDVDPIMQDLEEWMKDPNRDPDAKDVVDHMGGIIRTAPAVDAEPVRHGHWIDYEYSQESQCSICEHEWNWLNNDMETFNYCPNCGARMDEQVTGKLPASEEEET